MSEMPLVHAGAERKNIVMSLFSGFLFFEDAEFVKKYANKANETPTSTLKNLNSLQEAAATSDVTFSGKGSNPNGTVTAATLGTYTLNQGYINQSYEISMTTAMSKGTATNIKNTYTTITEVKKERKAAKAPMLFNLSALQTIANKVYKMSPQKVLEIAQSLYTKGYISYPRSDSQYLTENEARELPAILQKLGNKAEYKGLNHP